METHVHGPNCGCATGSSNGSKEARKGFSGFGIPMEISDYVSITGIIRLKEFLGRPDIIHLTSTAAILALMQYDQKLVDVTNVLKECNAIGEVHGVGRVHKYVTEELTIGVADVTVDETGLQKVGDLISDLEESSKIAGVTRLVSNPQLSPAELTELGSNPLMDIEELQLICPHGSVALWAGLGYYTYIRFIEQSPVFLASKSLEIINS